MKVVLTAVEPGLVDAWRRFCGDLHDVAVHSGSIVDIACDAVVSPANSFGFMDGGIDGVYLDHFGRDLQRRVPSVIYTFHNRELLVGQADIVPTGRTTIPWLICAPTMRVPMILGDTVNPYLAARACCRCPRDPGTTPFVVSWPVTLTWPGALALEVSSDAPYTVVFTEREAAVCVEPQSAPPDAAGLGRAATVTPEQPLALTMTWSWRRL